MLGFFTKKKHIDQQLSKIIEESRDDFEDKPLSEQERELLSSAIRFHDLQADEVCVPSSELAYVDITDDYETVINKFKESRVNNLLVVNDTIDVLVGIVCLTDMLDYIHNQDDFSLKTIVRNCTFVPENLQLPKVVKQMKNNRNQIAVVVDEYGGTSGVITVKDILSEFVGDIDEEENLIQELIKPIKKNSYLIDPRVEISDLKQRIINFEYCLDEDDKDDFETLSGLIYQITKKIPSVGETFNISENWVLKILDVDPRKINLVELVYVEKDNTENNQDIS